MSTQSHKPQALTVQLNAVPKDLQLIPRWLCWRLVERKKVNGASDWAKVPFTSTGRPASSTNPATWCSFDQAANAWVLGDFDGIGLVLGDDVQGIDLDDCRDPATGELSELARQTLSRIDGYAEVSPSGTGIKIFTRINVTTTATNHDKGVEIYCRARYFTVTGHLIEGHDRLPLQKQDCIWLLRDLIGREPANAPSVTGGATALEHYKRPMQDWDVDRVQNELLVHLDPDCGYNEWVQVGMTLHHQGQGDAEWLNAWDEWSAQSGKYVDGECEAKWKSFHQQRATGTGAVTLASLLAKTANARRQANLALHPLLHFVGLDNPPAVPRWVLTGFVAEGTTAIAGKQGIGKTTTILPLSLVAAGIHLPDDPLAPKHWRHVIYVTEDVAQAHRILCGLTQHHTELLNTDKVRDRLHLVEARRMSVGQLVQVGQPYRERFTRVVDGVELPPLVVLDTRAAVIAEDDENDNSGASKIVAALKQQFANLPTWVIGHIAKTNFGRTDASDLSMRGGSAFEADANQVLYLISENDGTRFLVRGKTRFEASWTELEIQSRTAHTIALDAWGDPETVTLRWGCAVPPEVPRTQRKALEREAEKTAAEVALRERVLATVRVGQETGAQLTKTALRKQLGGKAANVDAAVDALLASGDICYRTIPKEERINPQRQFELVLREMAFLE